MIFYDIRFQIFHAIGHQIKMRILNKNKLCTVTIHFIVIYTVSLTKNIIPNMITGEIKSSLQYPYDLPIF